MKKILLSISILFALNIFAQTNTYKGKVIDADTHEALMGVNIYNTNNQTGTITDINGRFSVEAHSQDEIEISAIGYKKIVFKAGDLPDIVKLQPTASQLQEVIISADRTRQQRTDVPIAITQISPKELEETNPITLEEVVNKAPGIMMIDLGNEQHSMSIRQPISYKSVFLYLEDGLPIRATGVFNHNALIEINHSSLKKIEIIRGPYSALYGSGAIGGAINFITKDPTATPYYKFYATGNNVGFRQGGIIASNTFGNTGLMAGVNYSGRKNGYREHSDYYKYSFFFKMTNKLNDKAYIKSSVNYIDYKTDMTGGLDSLYFYGQDYTSQYRFTYRKVRALRYYSQLVYDFNENNQLNSRIFARYNDVGQNPHYRIKDDYKPWNGTGDPHLAHSEINDNQFYSIGTVIQDQYTKDKLKLTGGISLDYSPNSYKANYIRVHKTDDAIYDYYQKTDSVLSDYKVNLFNVGIYANAEYKFSEKFKLLGAFRYDNISYDYKNHLGTDAFSGVPDTKNTFNAFTPRIGAIVKANDNISFYANYGKGFRPPEVGELYRGVKVPELQPVYYDNYEGGTWINLFDKKVIMDLSYYFLKAENEIISVKLDDGSRVNRNAAETQHKGFEFGVQLFPVKQVSLKFNGAVSEHKFIDYKPKGKDYSGNEMPGAPKLIMSSEIKYHPDFLKKSYIGLEWFHVDPYYMDEANTKKYEGYDVFNLRIGKKFKNFKVWFNILNLTDKLYATSASKSAWGTSYRPGEKRSFNLGLSYTIK